MFGRVAGEVTDVEGARSVVSVFPLLSRVLLVPWLLVLATASEAVILPAIMILMLLIATLVAVAVLALLIKLALAIVRLLLVLLLIGVLGHLFASVIIWGRLLITFHSVIN